ncbi:hypothetical protein NL676_021097 [Syzygium grande]|nr:hypothetical protein NL676_021097 [Syzygium grande]
MEEDGRDREKEEVVLMVKKACRRGNVLSEEEDGFLASLGKPAKRRSRGGAKESKLLDGVFDCGASVTDPSQPCACVRKPVEEQGIDDDTYILFGTMKFEAWAKKGPVFRAWRRKRWPFREDETMSGGLKTGLHGGDEDKADKTHWLNPRPCRASRRS